MKFRASLLFGFCCLLVVAGARVSGQPKAMDFSGISKTEIEMLIADVAKVNPNSLKRFVNDPESKRQQIESLRQLFAFASQAQREGFAAEPTNRQELDNIRAEVLAVNYDLEINKNKKKKGPWGYITDRQVAAYWGANGRLRAAVKREREAEFDRFLKAKIEILEGDNPEKKDREVTEDEKIQARDIFAKTHIYLAEYEQNVKAGKLPRLFVDTANLQVKLQQAQFLARIYAEKIADEIMTTDADIAKYIAEHPELDTSAKKAKAEQILKRAAAGEDFAALANKFSEDPGNKGLNGEPQGGIYIDVPKGKMVAPFEASVLALEPGQVAPNVVETDFGYHIIKLEKKGTGKDDAGRPTLIYDVRHILISTMHKDPSDVGGRDMPVREYVRNRLEEGKEKLLVERLVAENKISVPEDFTVPEINEKQPAKSTKKTRVVKKRPVKKSR